MRYEFLLLSTLLVVVGCPSGDEPSEDGSSSSSSGGETGSSSTAQPPTSSSSSSAGPTTDEPGTSSGETTDAPTGDETGTDTGTPSTCESATLWAGNPFYDGEFSGWNPTGHPLDADLPLRSRQLAAVGDRVAINTQSEVWLADGTEAVRLAGLEGTLPYEYQPSGACEDVRLIISEGVTGLPNGNIVVADTVGHALIELADPTGTCMASAIAGNQVAGIESEVENLYGDVDGPGAEAQLYAPTLPIADGDGNIFFVDGGNHKIKRVASDADRTVTTLATLDSSLVPFALTELDGVIYVVGSDGSNDIMLTVDASTPGDPTILFNERGHFEEFDSSIVAQLAGIAPDGAQLLVASAKGYLWRVSTSGEQLATLGGTGNIADIPMDIDLSQPIPLAELPLRTYSSARQILVPRGADFLFAGSDGGRGYHVWEIDCG